MRDLAPEGRILERELIEEPPVDGWARYRPGRKFEVMPNGERVELPDA